MTSAAGLVYELTGDETNWLQPDHPSPDHGIQTSSGRMICRQYHLCLVTIRVVASPCRPAGDNPRNARRSRAFCALHLLIRPVVPSCRIATRGGQCGGCPVRRAASPGPVPCSRPRSRRPARTSRSGSRPGHRAARSWRPSWQPRGHCGSQRETRVAAASLLENLHVVRFERQALNPFPSKHHAGRIVAGQQRLEHPREPVPHGQGTTHKLGADMAQHRPTIVHQPQQQPAAGVIPERAGLESAPETQ